MDRKEQLMAMIAENDGDGFLKHALGLELLKEGKDAEAEIIFTALLKENENYLGSYYHLGKLLEKKGDEVAANNVYKKGMQVALLQQDLHSYNELKSAWEYLEF